jgi:hypothetical protein
LQAFFVAIVERNVKRIKKIEQKLVPAGNFSPFSTKVDVTLDPLRAAF